MSFRSYIEELKQKHELLQISKPVSRTYEISGLLKNAEPRPVLFTNVIESTFQVAGNLFCSKQAFADYFNIQLEEIIPLLIQAIRNPRSCRIIDNPPCQEVIMSRPDLDLLPILKHCEQDGGNYISSAVVITSHPKYGQNMDFHRFMQLSSNEMAVRIVKTRHFDTFLEDRREMEIAVCIGNPPNVLAAAATSVEIGVNELEIANAMQPLSLTKALTSDLLIPAECEFVIEGKIYLNRKHAEGPFVDLTETYDVIRLEPVFEVKAISHRKNAIWQALLPGALEHKLLMGMPREPTIFNKVNEVVKCQDVNINPGGCSWLHAIVQIDKQNEKDAEKAIQAAFAGHRSCKHVFIVDKDINIYDPLEVEWAMATRFQADKDLYHIGRERGSSLDPSSEAETHLTSKLGFDLTKPLHSPGKSFDKAPFPQINLNNYLEEEE